jgi:pimeloyl-ACP methyl ester carboxylesterase
MTTRPLENRTIVLSDGRSMCFAEYGSPSGFVILNAHGGLACRLDVAAAHDAAAAAGVRLISPDRPGIGQSERRSGRTILDWTVDVRELMDQLDVCRFGVMGWSMGGQYAAAVGKALPQRVTGVAIIAGALPLTDPRIFAQLPGFDRGYTRLSEHAPMLARACFWTMGLAARIAPTSYGKLAARQLGGADGKVLREEGFRVFSRMSAEAFRQPAGVVDDYRAWVKPWGFDPEDLTVPVSVWSGNDDQLVSPEWAITLARRIPGATLRQRPGGHFLAHLHYPEIFDAIRR